MSASLSVPFDSSCGDPSRGCGAFAFAPDPFSCRLLQDLERRAFFDNAILRGSALYQPYIEGLHGLTRTMPPKDYDVLVNFGRYDEFRREQIRWGGSKPASDPSFLIDYLRLFHVVKNPEVKFAVPPDRDGRYFVNIGGVYRGRPMDLMVENLPHTLESTARRIHDAPITGIAMDSRGRIAAHPLFEAHAKALVYDPATVGLDPAAYRERFEKLSRKFPGLRLAEPEPRSPPAFRCRPHP
jgi:hypothetical protein